MYCFESTNLVSIFLFFSYLLWLVAAVIAVITATDDIESVRDSIANIYKSKTKHIPQTGKRTNMQTFPSKLTLYLNAFPPLPVSFIS